MSRKLRRIVSTFLAAALLIQTVWLAPAAEAAEPNIPVLLYHKVVTNPTDDWTHTSVDNFKKHMQYLDDNGYTTLTAEQYVSILKGEAAPEDIPAKPILLTFDDATSDFVENTVPILNEHDMNAVQFVVSGWIGGGFSMSLAQLESIVDNNPNISIQNHSVNHDENIWNSISESDASAEIATANEFIKGITGKDSILFAYPYGQFNANAQAAAADNGIKYSFKVGYPNEGDHAMGRHYIKMSTTLSEIAGWIGGPAPAEEPDTVTIYHEDFDAASGDETQSGGASLTRVSDKVFAGNADGKALYVSNRTNDYDAADFEFSELGMENGKTYSVTASVYVDADTSVPTGAQAALQTINNFGWLAGVNFVAGEALTLTAKYTVNTSLATSLRFQTNPEGKTVPFYIGDILVTADIPPDTGNEPGDYHEAFDTATGVETPSGGATLTRVVDKVFDGNADGKALYISNRVNNYDAADFKFSDLGMENGKTYLITAKGYVDANATVPAGAQAWLQTINDYGLLTGASFVAGEAFTLTSKFTVDTSKATSLRFQSNEEGKSVPFFIGDLLITADRPPALNFSTIDFEDQTAGGFLGRAGTETLTVTDEANHTNNGSYALKVEGRSNTWHGPALRVEKYVDQGFEYKISFWVKLVEPASSQLQLSTQVGQTTPSFNNLTQKTISTNDGWVQFEGTYRYTNASSEYLTIYVESSNNATASFYIDDISFENTGSGPIGIQKDLTPIKEAYENDFLIGNAVSSADMAGTRLELLKMHHNVVTAENAMKPDQLYATDKTFSPGNADALVDKALAEGLQVHGHVLVWHQQSPTWLNTITDSENNTIPLGRDDALANLKTHIETVMEHFGDKVISWDVVNEAMNDNPSNPTDWKAALRQSPWYTAIGSDYVEQSFLAAREVLDANPGWDIKLYYNDYNDDNQNKAQAIYSMVKEINDKYALTHPGKLLIDGVGMQGHYNVNTNPENVKLSLEKFISLGVEVSITELDITAGSNSQLSEKLANAQGYLYAELFKIYKAHAANIKRVTFWGLNDSSSWRAAQNPLLFDKDLQAKPAYYGVTDPDKFMEEHIPESTTANQSTAKFATPAVDGTVDSAWSEAAEIPINRYQMAWQGATGVAKALWDDQNLYVLIQVSDAQLDKTSAAAYEQDSVEIFLDQNNEKTSSYQADDGQYRVNFDNETSFNPTGIETGFASATKVSGTNYTVEVKIPLTSVTPGNDKKLGFDVQINDAKDGARQSVAAWNDTTGTGYMDTSNYGELTLVGKVVNSGGGSVYIPSTGSVVDQDGVVTIKPEVKNDGGRVTGKVSDDNLKRALELADPAANGKKQIVIDVPKQSDVKSYEVQLPTSSLKGTENFVLLLSTENATIEIPSNMLSNVTETAEQVSIRVTKASTDGLDAATRERIGNRPVLDLNLVVGDKVVAWNNPDAPVKVSVPYTPTAEELSNPDSIVVWYIDGKGNATSIPNGRYDAATGTVVFQTTHFSTYAVTSVVKTFGDLKNVPWAKQAIDAMAARDVIKGTSENSFAPSAFIKRADFIALLVRALELQGNGKEEVMFSDVDETAYYYNELAIAKALGIATGIGDNTFNPNGNISRQDMMVLTARALAEAGKHVEANGALDAYPDAASISAYAKNSVAGLVKSGIVNGKNGKLAPSDTLTRAEAAVILYRIWNL